MRRGSVLLVAGLTFASLGGCLKDAGWSTSGGALLDATEPCPKGLVDNCGEVAKDADAAYVIDGFRYSRESGASTALQVKDLNRGLVLRNFDIRAWQGVRIDGSPECSRCTILIEDGVLRPTTFMMSGSDGLKYPRGGWGIWIEDWPGSLVVRNFSADLPQAGRINTNVVRVQGQTTTVISPMGGADVFHLDGIEGSIEFANITTRAAGANYGQFLESYGDSTAISFSLLDAGLEGVLGGAEFSASEVRLQNVTLKCGLEGLMVDAASLFAKGLVIDGCADQALYLLRLDRAELEGLRISNSSRGIEAQSLRTLVLRDFVFRDLGWGLIMPYLAPTGGALIEQGLIENMTYGGITIGWPTTQVRGITCRDAGEKFPDPVMHNWLKSSDYGCVVVRAVNADAAVSVTGSRFEGSEPFAVVSVTTVVNATDNWWGDAGGPRVRSTQPNAPFTAPGAGDPISERVRFVPFRASP